MVDDWTPLAHGVAWTSPPLFTFAGGHDAIRSRFGPPIAAAVDSNGLGPMDVWALRFACGLEVTLLVFRMRGCELLAPSEAHEIEVHANERDEAHLRFHLGLSANDISKWQPDPLRPAPARWHLRRQDDNGHVAGVYHVRNPEKLSRMERETTVTR